MEYYNFLNSYNICDYNTLKQYLSNINIKFKENNNLFLMYQEQDETNFNDNLLIRNCLGLICRIDTLKIVCYSFNRCVEFNNGFNPIINLDNFRLEKAYEGSLMRVYFYDNKWNISTKRCLDANNAYWISDKSFYELFIECLPTNFNIYDILNKNYCYSFLLCHPNNNIITKDKPHLIHLNTRNIENLNIVEHDLGFNKPYIYTEYNKNNINELFDKLDNEYEGYIIIDNYDNRQKIEGKMYRFLKDLWGNTNNRIYRYFELRKYENDLINYLTYFKDDALFFKNIEVDLINFFKKIHNLYIERHVKKNKLYLDYPYSVILYNLHGFYISNKKPILYSDVVQYINSLNISILYRYYLSYVNNIKNKNEICKYYVKGFNIYNNNLPDLIDENGEINNN